MIFTASVSPATTVYPLTYTWTVNNHIVLGDNSGANPTLTLTWTQLQALGIDDGPNTFAVSVAVTDDHAGSATSPPTTLSLANTPPTAALSGPASAVIYQPLTFTLGATAPSATDQAAGFMFTISWGDGSQQTFMGASGQTATHSYTTAGTGTYTVTLQATDKDRGVSQAVTESVSVSATPLIENGVLAIPGTATAAIITLTPTQEASAYSMDVRYSGNATKYGPYAASTIDVYGGPDTDAVTLSGTAYYDAFTLGNSSVSEVAAQNTQQATSFTVGLNAVTALSLKGGASADSLTGPNQVNAWGITGGNTGTLNATTSFTSIANLIGGGDADTFSFADGGSVSGTVNGGGGAATLDFSGDTTAVKVTMEASGPNEATATGGWTNIATVIGATLGPSGRP